jgi:ribonuclease HI
MDVIIYTDGGARGNPGPAASGTYIIDNNNKVLAKIGKYLGETTNNVAEYTAIVEGLLWVKDNKGKMDIKKIIFFMDSQLVCSQLTGVYKIKNEKLREINFKIKILEQEIKLPIFYNHIPREQNKNADFIVNLTLDNILINS